MAGEDPKHLERIRRLRCCQCGRHPPSEAHHITGAGLALRAHDHRTIPLCTRCHRAFHDANGPFKGWDKKMRKQWQESALEMVVADADASGTF